jgi:serine-type D-Ala-D-Ala carboxypeptidase/endopeptidase (penicillin-binding protein 4)
MVFPKIRHAIGTALALYFLLSSCTIQKNINNASQATDVFQDSNLRSAHVGVAVFDVSGNRYIYQYQSEKYFIPASNAKLFSLYAAMKWLGDSIPAIRYLETDTALYLLPMGDPTLLHPDFSRQPLIDMLKKSNKSLYILSGNWNDEAWGSGWSWDDYNDEYMVERSPLPVYGNIIRWTQEMQEKPSQDQGFPSSPSFFSLPEVDWKLKFSADTGRQHFYVHRNLAENLFVVTQGKETKASQDVPFITNGLASAIELLKDTIGRPAYLLDAYKSNKLMLLMRQQGLSFTTLHSQPVDSVYRPLMYRSDNFFAEQLLMMVSQLKLGTMNDELIIDSLLKSDLHDLPQRPNWADGSGLSRYNLFTPQDFVWLLNKMQKEFGIERLKRLLPTGGSGTLSHYFKQDSGHIYAKTGSLSGVLGLSGYLITRRNHLLIFSFLVNNHLGRVSEIRTSMETFLHIMIENY